MKIKHTYAIVVYKYNTLWTEEYALYNIDKDRLQSTITDCLKEDKSFKVAVF